MAWQIDPAHSAIHFSVRHMMITNVRGEFEKFGGVIEADLDNPEAATVDIQIEANTINTREPRRDAHLRSADFLDAEHYPVLTFKSKRVERTGENAGRLIGDLTIRGEAREVALDVEFLGLAKSPWGATSAGFEARTRINRKDWGLNWNQALETGGVLVGDQINIEIELELIKQEEVEAVAG
jgi:polyisoprenoid-binding protein YceI